MSAMSGASCLVAVSEFFTIQKRIEDKLSAKARDTCRLTRQFHEEPEDGNAFDVVGISEDGTRRNPMRCRTEPTRQCFSLSPRSVNSRRLQRMGPFAAPPDSIGWSPSLGYEMDVDYRTGAAFFSMWSDMLAAGGSIALEHFTFSIQPSDDELSLFVLVGCQSCFFKFNHRWFLPENCSLWTLTEQLVQLLCQATGIGAHHPDQLPRNSNKRPALE